MSRKRSSSGTSAGDAAPKKPKTLGDKFGGMSEEEVCKLLLPDHLRPGLDIVFMGINPGLYSAYLGHHYCNSSNHFWPCLFESGLVPCRLSWRDDAELPQHGIGISNIVPRTTRTADKLSRQEIRTWSKVMVERMQQLKPLVVCFNGKGIYEVFTGHKCAVGLQSEALPDTDIAVYVMPSTSGRAATYPRRADKLKFFIELKAIRDRLKAGAQTSKPEPARNEAVVTTPPTASHPHTLQPSPSPPSTASHPHTLQPSPSPPPTASHPHTLQPSPSPPPTSSPPPTASQPHPSSRTAHYIEHGDTST